MRDNAHLCLWKTRTISQMERRVMPEHHIPWWQKCSKKRQRSIFKSGHHVSQPLHLWNTQIFPIPMICQYSCLCNFFAFILHPLRLFYPLSFQFPIIFLLSFKFNLFSHSLFIFSPNWHQWYPPKGVAFSNIHTPAKGCGILACYFAHSKCPGDVGNIVQYDVRQWWILVHI
jgi:hypothetical protein